MSNETFGGLLDKRLEGGEGRPRVSRSEFAKEIGVVPSMVTKYCNNESKPKLETMLEIVKFLKIEGDELKQWVRVAGFWPHWDLFKAQVEATQKFENDSALQLVTPSVELEVGTAKQNADHSKVKFSSSYHATMNQFIAPFMVPNLPIHGVLGRNDTLVEIYNKLQINDENVQNVQPVALQGMGGIGKTTLATAFGRLESILNFFPDGVLWVSVGPKPAIRLLLNSWGKMLNIDLLAEPDEEACKERLRSALHHQRALLIIDDVWEIEQGQYFNLAGPKCKTLITTRETPIAYDLATRERTLRVDVLKPEYAFALLRNLVPDVVVADEKNTMRLCERLEFLPLALTLAGRLLANEADVPSHMQRLLDELIDRRETRLNLFQTEQRPGIDERRPSLQAILGMSVDRLDEIEKERFAMLSEFGAEPLTWEVDAVAYVWDCSEVEAEKTISHFIKRGLVTPRSNGEYWMHALLVDYAAYLLQEMNL